MYRLKIRVEKLYHPKHNQENAGVHIATKEN